MTSEPVWEIPEPLSVCEVRLDDDTVTTLRRHGNSAGPRLVLSHGNGLAIDLYYPFWALLADEFDLIVYDLRNHGWNTVGARSKHNLPTLVRDQECILESIDRHYGNKPIIGVFHSLSALITLLTPAFSSAKDTVFSAWVLFDPPLCKPGIGEADFDVEAEYKAGMTRRRGHRFQTREDFTELLNYLPLLIRAVPGARELMARTVLRESPDGQGYELRCPRDYEAQIIEYIRNFTALIDFGALPCPTKVIGADPTLPYSYLPTFDFRHILTVEYDFIPEATHLLQLEKPAECVAAMREFLERNRLL